MKCWPPGSFLLALFSNEISMIIPNKFSKSLLQFAKGRCKFRGTEGHIDGQKDIWMDRRTYGWTEGHMNGQKDTIVKNSFSS